MVDFGKFKKKAGSIPPTTMSSILPDEPEDSENEEEQETQSRQKRSGQSNITKNKLTDHEARIIALEISMSMHAPKAKITNDLFWKTAKANASLAGIRNLIDYVSRRNTKEMTPEQIAILEDHRSGFTDAIVKIFNILQGGTPDGG